MAEMYTEAFKELELLTEDTFNADDAGIKALSNFIKEQDLEDEPVEIIDVKAKSEFDLADSYVGKVIFKCPACHTLLYHDKEDIEFDEDKDKVNVAEECPYCGNSGGFYIVGEVAPYSEVEVKVDDDVVDESLKSRKSKSMKEFLQTIDEFKTWKFKDKTEQGYEVKGLYKDLDDNRLHVIAFRPGRKDYLVGLGYNPDEGYWNQGRYDFQTPEDAVNSLKGDYKVEVFKKEVNESLKESVADIELKDEDYIFEEETGNIHVAEDAIKYHPKYKKYINFRFVDDNDDKVLTYKLVGKTDEPKYPYEFEYVGEAKDFNESCGKKTAKEDLGSWLAAKKYQKLDKKLTDKKASGNLSDEEKKKLELKKKSALARARAGAKPEDPETGEDANKTQQILDKTKTTQNQRGGQASALKTLMDRVGVANKTELLAKLRKAGIRVTEAFNMDTKTLKEAFEKVELETATEKIKVSSEPKEEIKEADETIVPMTDESANEIIDMNIEDIDEDELEELGEGFLKRVYENVDSFKINSKKLTENKIIAEGLIKFKSGKEKPTTFTFTPDRVTKSGKYKFLGENLSITKKKNAFTLTGKLNNNKFLSESLTYNYNQRNNKNEAKRIYGRVIKH